MTFELPGNQEATIEKAGQLRSYFLNNHSIELMFVPFNGKMCFRIAAQIYNEINDYAKLAGALEEVA